MQTYAEEITAEQQHLFNLRPERLSLPDTFTLCDKGLLEKAHACLQDMTLPLAIQNRYHRAADGTPQVHHQGIELFGSLWAQHFPDIVQTTPPVTLGDCVTETNLKTGKQNFFLPFSMDTLRVLLEGKRRLGRHIHNFIYFSTGDNGEVLVAEFTWEPTVTLFHVVHSDKLPVATRTWAPSRAAEMLRLLSTPTSSK